MIRTKYVYNSCMKTSEFMRKISKAGCCVYRRGSSHDVWVNPKTGGKTSVSRHVSQELSKGTVEGMLKELGLK